jgi:hypothetical protein
MPSAGLIHIMALVQGIEVKNKLLESTKNLPDIPARRNSAMMDICAAHEDHVKKKLTESTKNLPENPARKNCCLILSRTTLEISLLVSITANILFLWYTIWSLLKNTCEEKNIF